MKLVLDFLLISGLLFTASIIVLLVKRKEKEVSHKILITIFIAILIVFLSYYSYLHRIAYLFYSAYIFTASIDVFIGPLFLIYVQSITGTARNSIKGILPHFVFPIIYMLAITVPELVRMLNDTYTFNYLDHLFPYVLFTILYSLGYCLYALFKLSRFQGIVKQQYSNLENKNLNWIKHLLLGIIGIMIINISTSIYESYFGEHGWDIDFITVIPIVFLVGYMGYYGISQSSILLPDFLKTGAQGNGVLKKKENPTSDSKTYQYDNAEMQSLKILLQQIIEKEKPYLKEGLTLTALAGILHVPDKKLSTLLSTTMNTSFYDYVNQHRVAEVKRRLATSEAEKFTLLAIAYDCGFNSKSSFNRIFKKLTNQSPSDYKKAIQ